MNRIMNEVEILIHIKAILLEPDMDANGKQEVILGFINKRLFGEERP